MSEWKIARLDQVSSIKSGKRLPKGHKLVSKNTKLPYIRLVDVTNGVIKRDNLMFLESDTQKLISRYIVKEGDVCLAIVGDTIGMVFQVDNFFNGANLTENAARLTSFDDQILSQFLYYYLISKIGQEEIISRKVGSAQGKLPLYNIRSLPINLPSIPEQKAIAHILGSLDEKIELNRQMNQTLEAMAQALFKSWFVDFDPVLDNALTAGNEIPEALQAMAEKRQLVPDSKKLLNTNPSLAAQFPSAFEFNEVLGKWIPEGWEVKSLDKIADYQNGLALQKFRPIKEDDDFLPVLKISHLKEGKTDGIEKARLDINPECKVENGDILFSWSASLFVDIWCGGRAALNQHLFKVTSQKFPKWFYYLYTKHHLDNFIRIANDKAVTMGHIKREHLSEAMCSIMPMTNLLQISSQFENLIAKQIANRLEQETLTQLRDRLLPELISGRVRVKEVKELIH